MSNHSSDKAVTLDIPLERKKYTISIILGVLLLFLTCAIAGTANKITALLLIGVAIVVLFVKRKRKVLLKRMSWQMLFFSLYVAMDGISTLYARSGKFALTEFLKVISAACIVILITAFEPQKQKIVGRCTGIMLETAGALATIFSIDKMSTHILYNIFITLISPFNQSIAANNALTWNNQMVSIFEWMNPYCGAIGVCILVSLGLVVYEDNAKWRKFHLACAQICSIGFMLAISRGAMASIAIAFVLYLALARGMEKAKLLLSMVEVFVVTLLSSFLIWRFPLQNDGPFEPRPLLTVIAATTLVCIFDHFVVRKTENLLSNHTKLLSRGIIAIEGLAVVFVILALNLSTAITLPAGANVTRSIDLKPGDYTLTTTANNSTAVNINYLVESDGLIGGNPTIYEGDASSVTFTVPEDSRLVNFCFYAPESEIMITSAAYSGASNGKVKLRYVFLPASIADRLQGLFKSQNFTERTAMWHDGLTLWKQNPIFGLGMGSFQNASISVQTYHYESKYTHNHYIESLLETGVIGFVLWVGLLLSSAVAIFFMWRRGDTSHPLTSTCGALLLFLAVHAFVEVDFSYAYFLPFGYGAFALINLCCGEAIPVKQLTEKAKNTVPYIQAGLLAVFAVLLALNMYAKLITLAPTYERMASAVAIDKYEWADNALSYVYGASSEAELSEKMQKNVNKYLKRLEKQNSNTIPYYLALTYFNMNNPEKAYEMLIKYIDYTAGDSEHWQASFAVALQYYDGSESSHALLQEMYNKMNTWNAENLGNISISDDVRAAVETLIAQ